MLTAKQQQTYQFIKEYFLRYNIAPTEAEIALGIGITSRGVVHRYVTALKNLGLIEITANRRRNIKLVEDCANEFRLPVIGEIAAGHPIEAIEQHHAINLADKILGPNRFLLLVKGDSMIGDNICDGDYVLCEKREEAKRHEIAVVLVHGSDATLKRVHNNNDGTVTLIPSNPTLKEKNYPANAIQIQGIYLGLLRFM